jgi:hypothetical protein
MALIPRRSFIDNGAPVLVIREMAAWADSALARTLEPSHVAVAT